MLKVKQKGDNYFVSLTKITRINTLIADGLREQLNEIIKHPGRNVVLSLKNIKFIDSSGFEAILSVVKKSKKHNSNFRICDVSEEVYELIKLMKFNILFEISPEKIYDFSKVF